MKMRNIILAFKDQMPLSRFLRNFRKGHILGLFHKNSHYRGDTGQPKIMYNTKASAKRAAEVMTKKRGMYFSNYKCIQCDGFHIGKNSENK